MKTKQKKRIEKYSIVNVYGLYVYECLLFIGCCNNNNQAVSIV